MKYVVAYSSYIGMRKSNQDAMLIKTAYVDTINIGLFVVCDGLGGLNYGEVASSNVVKYLDRWFDREKHSFSRQTDEELEINLKNEINMINRKIIDYSHRLGSRVGTTLTLMLNIGEKFFCCHVGDCRLYEVGESIFRLTKDHTVVQYDIDRGFITEREAKKDKRKNMLLQCIGVKEKINIDFSGGLVSKGGIYVLCSDGFYKMTDEVELKTEFTKYRKLSEEFLNEKIEYFTSKALNSGEKDNISAIAFALV